MNRSLSPGATATVFEELLKRATQSTSKVWASVLGAVVVLCVLSAQPWRCKFFVRAIMKSARRAALEGDPTYGSDPATEDVALIWRVLNPRALGWNTYLYRCTCQRKRKILVRFVLAEVDF